MRRPSQSPKIGYFIQSRGPGDSVEFEEVYVYGPTRRSDEGIVGHDLQMRPTRLGPGDYTFVGSPDDVKWSRPVKSHAQIKREVDEALTRGPGKSTQTINCPCVEAGECNCHRMHFTERCECPACAESQALSQKKTRPHATIAKTRPWQGTIYNERRISGVHNALVSIYLDGVVGVSPVIGEQDWRQIQPDRADTYLKKGKAVLEEVASQKAPPSARSWYKHNVKQLRDLLEKAQAVRDGATPQKMTEESYAELQRSISRR